MLSSQTFLLEEHAPVYIINFIQFRILIGGGEKKIKNLERNKEITYGVSNNHMRNSIVSAEVQANFHARIAAADDQNLLVCEVGAGLIRAGMNNMATEPLHPNNLRYHRLGILAGGNNKPPGNVLQVLSANPPKPTSGIELGALDGLVEPGVD